MAVEPFHVKGKSKCELEGFFLRLGEPAFRAKQMMEWIYQRDVADFTEIPVFGKGLRETLQMKARIGRLALIERMIDQETGAIKLLLGLDDGEQAECVLLSYRYGLTVCISTQVGCRMACRFCASAGRGLARNLDAGEMIDQVLATRRYNPAGGGLPTRIVLMGTGEPLDNYDQSLALIRLAGDPSALGISLRRITLSTCGLVPGILRLAEERLPITLAVSLHAPRDETRSSLVPVNRRYPIRELLDACRIYARKTGRRITFEYLLLKGINDSRADARLLAEQLRELPSHVNLLLYNRVDALQKNSASFESPSRPEAESFQRELEMLGVGCTIRRSLGVEIEAACGQLRRRAAARGEGT
ncbi:MAG: 23S rRNA (adenine(2503)-C(2))-methyltransferase RlmN [Firmicutes bacterium]|nr:23S rRNA (adenine(2503)-C(2))-methyltransferase RlmN [Bacillota bacterium]